VENIFSFCLVIFNFSSRQQREITQLFAILTYIYAPFCLSKPQAWHIIAARSVAYIIKGGSPPLYLITRQRAFSCGLMIYRRSKAKGSYQK